MLKKLLKGKKGFTLVELLIVVAIIGILAGIAIPNFMGARTKAQVARAFSDMDAIAKAEQMYYMDHMSSGYGTAQASLTTTYIRTWPSAPWDDYRIYTTSVTGDTAYDAFAILNDGPDDDEDVTDASPWNWGSAVVGAIGGSEGADSAYGISGDNAWYDPANGSTSSGDIGYGGG